MSNHYELRKAYKELTFEQKTDPVEAYYMALFETFFENRKRTKGIALSHPVIVKGYNGYSYGLLMYSARNKTITYTSAYTENTLFIATKDSLHIPHRAYNTGELSALGIQRFVYDTRSRKRELYLLTLDQYRLRKYEADLLKKKKDAADPSVADTLICFSSGDVTFHKGGKVDKKDDLVRTVVDKELYNKLQKTKRDVYALLSAEFLIGDIELTDDHFDHKLRFPYYYSTFFIPELKNQDLIDIFTDVEKTRDILIKAAISRTYKPKDYHSSVNYTLKNSLLYRLAPRNYSYIDKLATKLGIVKYL